MNKKRNIQERRDAVLDLYSEGYNLREIANKLKTSKTTVHKDIRLEKDRLRNNRVQYYIDFLPFEHKSCIIGLNKVLRYTWDIIHNGRDIDAETHKKLISGLSLAKDCYIFKEKLLDSEASVKDVTDRIDQLLQKAKAYNYDNKQEETSIEQ